MKNLTQLDGALIGLCCAMVWCLCMFILANVLPFIAEYLVEKYRNRGGGEKQRKRDRWRIKLGLTKLKN